MSKQEPPSETRRLTVTVIEGEHGPLYDLSTAASIVDAHPDLIRHYHAIGLVRAIRVVSEEPMFDDDSIYWLRQIEALRRNEKMGQGALRLILELRREVEELRRELRFRPLP